MGTIEVTLKEANADGISSYVEYDLVAALMEHNIGYLFMLRADGEEVIQSMSDISSLEVSNIIIEHVD